MTKIAPAPGPHLTAAFIGFGEAGSAIARGLLSERKGVDVLAYDIKTASPDAQVRDAKVDDYRRTGVTGVTELGLALAAADLIFSTVTADQALLAAQAAAPLLRPGAFYLDLNSCAPHTKQNAATLIAASGAHYADIAVMAPILPLAHKTPMLVAAPQIDAVLSILNRIGMAARPVGPDIGSAAAIKLIRSIMIKGMEALAIECTLAGVKSGAAEEVFRSLDESFPGFGWRERAAHMIERAMTHGVRRAAELEEASHMLDQMGIGSIMSVATARREREVGQLQIDARTLGKAGYRDYALAILDARARSTQAEGRSS